MLPHTRALDTCECLEALYARGCRKLLVQLGNGSYTCTLLKTGHVSIGNDPAGGIEVEMCRYIMDLPAILKQADLVVSHAGAGSIFETLSLGERS